MRSPVVLHTHTITLSHVCVCVCVCVRERESVCLTTCEEEGSTSSLSFLRGVGNVCVRERERIIKTQQLPKVIYLALYQPTSTPL